MFSFLRGTKEEISIIFDINAESVGAGILLCENEKTTRLIYTCREFFDKNKNAKSAAETIDLMVATLKIVQEFLAKNILSSGIFRNKKVSYVHVVFSTPWVETRIKNIHIEYKNPIVVTKSIVRNIIENESNAFKKELSQSSGGKSFFDVIEKKPISFKLNGYSVSDPFGKETKTLDISISLSFIPTEIEKKIFDIGSYVGARRSRLSILSFSVVIFSALKNVVSQNDFVVLDILSGMTNVFIVMNGTLQSEFSFPVGDNAFIENVVKKFGLSPAEARSRMELFFRKHADQETENSMDEVFAESMDVWKRNFEMMLEDMTNRGAVPRNLYVLVREDEAPFFMRAIAGEKANEFGIENVSFSPTFVDRTFFKSKILVEENATDQVISFEAFHLANQSDQGKIVV